MTKQDLIEYKTRRLDVHRLADELKELEVVAYNVRALRYDSNCGGGGDSDDRLATLIDRLDEKRRHLAAAYMTLLEADSTLEQELADLPPIERAVITGRYVRGLRWDTLARELNYSTRQVQRIHGNALLHLAQVNDVAQCHIEKG